MAQLNRISLVSLIALGLAMPAMAQNTTPAGPQTAPQAPPEDEKDTRAGRDVVVVTAQKREETVQDIAVAVTAITDEMRDQIGLTTVQDYTNFAPGLSYSTANDRLGMRGVTRTSNNFGIRSGISNYVDGVYFSSAIPASREPIFVERVEVVRGPQGTLYGRDSIGGALNVITKRPTEEFEGQVNMQYGSLDTIGVAGTFAGPITDWMRYRVGYSRQAQNEGYFTNYSGETSEGGRKDDTYIEGQLEFDIGDDLDLWVRAGSLNWDVRYGAPGARTSADDPYPYNTRFFNSTAELGPNGWAGLIAPSRTQVGSQSTNPALTDPNGFNTSFSNYAKLSPTSELAVEAVWHAPAFDIKYLGGYVWYNYDLEQDQDGTAVKSFTCTTALCGSPTFNNRVVSSDRVSTYVENRGWYSNELNFLSTWDGPLQVVAGLYQYQENYNQLVYVTQLDNPGGAIRDFGSTQAWLTAGGPLLGAPPPAALPELPGMTGRNSWSGAQYPGGSLMFHTNNQALNNAYGAFVQTDWQLNDQWKLTAGLRYSKDVQNGREYARVINHYNLESLLEAPFSAAYTPLVGGNAALAQSIVAAATPTRLDVTRTLGGPDPSTISTANPCGFAGQGVVNTNITPANSLSANCPAGNANDKSRYGIYYDPITGNAYRDLHADFTEVTGVLGIDWTPDDDTLIYGKYNRGYKPGGLGCAAVFCTMVATPFTDKELVDAFELGFKREWADWNLTTNAVLFYYDYQGYQVSNTIVPDDPGNGQPRPPAYAAYVNLPEVHTTGFELETMWYPTDNLRFILNYGYTNPEIGASPSLVHSLDPFALDPAAQPQGAAASCTPVTANPATTCHGVQGQSLEGNILPFSPKNKIALNGVYTWDFEDGSKIDASLSYFWQDISFSSIFNRSYSKIPSWDQTDGRVSWTSSDGNFTLIGFIRNMFDETQYDSRGSGLRETASTSTAIPATATTPSRYIAPTECFTTAGTTPGAGTAPAQSCYQTGETYRPPRTWGVELQIRF
ncbi:MAG: TonB-dependent receptor [Hyphomonadaceae bacterium]